GGFTTEPVLTKPYTCNVWSLGTLNEHLIHYAGEALAEFAHQLPAAAEELEDFQDGLARHVIAVAAVAPDDFQELLERRPIVFTRDVRVRELQACFQVAAVAGDPLFEKLRG